MSGPPYDEQSSGPGGLPSGVDPLDVPHEHSGHDAFLLVAAVLLALLGLIFTLGWIAFHRLTS